MGIQYAGRDAPRDCIASSRLALLGQDTKSKTLFDQALAAQKRGDFATAIGDYQQVLKLEPGLVVARTNMAAALLQLGRLDAAADNYRLALKQQPGNPQIPVLLGNCLVLRGSYDEAIQLLGLSKKAIRKIST